MGARRQEYMAKVQAEKDQLEKDRAAKEIHNRKMREMLSVSSLLGASSPCIV